MDKSAYEVDFGQIKGQEAAKRACQVALKANYGLLLVGPPGQGKTMLARAFRTLHPHLPLYEFRPCRCEYRQDARRDCICSVKTIERHRKRMLKIGRQLTTLFIYVPALTVKEMFTNVRGTDSAEITETLRRSPDAEVPEGTVFDTDFLRQIYEDRGMSPAELQFVCQVSAAIAALDDANPLSPSAQHVAEAVNYLPPSH